MFNISTFLEKFSKKIKSSQLHNKQILNIIEKESNIKIDIENLEIKNNTIYIKSSPPTKNQLFIFKKRIIEKINSLTPNKIIDIK